MASNMHNTRLLRFLIVVTIVVLTIFIYASYSSTQTLSPPPMRNSAAASLMAFSMTTNNRSNNNEGSLEAGVLNSLPYDGHNKATNVKNSRAVGLTHYSNLPPGGGGSHGGEVVLIKKLSHHREPTIDENAIDGGGEVGGVGVVGASGAMADDVVADDTALEHFNNNNNDLLQEEQYVQSVDNNLAPEKYYLPLDPANDDNDLLDDNDEALPPSVIMTIKGGAGSSINNPSKIEVKQPQKAVAAAAPAPAVPAVSPGNSAKITSTTKKVPKVQADPTQGIPTEQIYEPGHMNEEIDVEQICPNKGNKLKLLILITSAQTHTEARLAIRQTWGHFGTRRDVSTAFILGRTTNATVSEALTQENIIYGDLIRGNFIDSYNNLTLKTLSSLEWVDQHCPKAKYILKTDDDMFINVPKLLQFLDAHSKDKRVIYGRLAKKWKPIRNKKSKYYISTGQFNAAVFPPFTTGPAYVLTSDIVHELYEKSLEQVYLKLEDVFTTGIVAQLLGIKRVHVNEFLNRRIAFNPCNIRKSISVHMIKANEQFDLWKKLLDQTTKCK
uniref:Hexosyltransferase n=1 Tax=Stomoxys calcitrans TaxID=35570 RepID=A0A1I8NRB9_STOCA